ncbi:hypothetical protein SK128_025242 [Halocaridina rubra]|uniref:Uncharacterized protein n=1 Tax=Halocaridina rubra TaxID=373956 RepID=A0AAN8XW00_HALRR
MLRVKRLQNFAARVAIGGVHKYDHVTPLFERLGWLRMDMKMPQPPILGEGVFLSSGFDGFPASNVVQSSCKIADSPSRASSQSNSARNNT